MDPRQWAARNVANNIAAGTGSAQTDSSETFQNLGHRFDTDPVELDILAHGDVGNAVAVLRGNVRDGTHLLAAEQPVGNTDADHEVGGGLPFTARATENAFAVALRINAPSAEVCAEPFGWDGRMPLLRELANLVEMVPSIFLKLKAFDLLRFRFFGGRHFLMNSLFANAVN